MTFAEKLKAWRKSKRLTQASAAQWLSVSLDHEISIYTLISWEQRRHEPQALVRSLIEKVIAQ